MLNKYQRPNNDPSFKVAANSEVPTPACAASNPLPASPAPTASSSPGNEDDDDAVLASTTIKPLFLDTFSALCVLLSSPACGRNEVLWECKPDPNRSSLDVDPLFFPKAATAHWPMASPPHGPPAAVVARPLSEAEAGAVVAMVRTPRASIATPSLMDWTAMELQTLSQCATGSLAPAALVIRFFLCGTPTKDRSTPGRLGPSPIAGRIMINSALTPTGQLVSCWS